MICRHSLRKICDQASFEAHNLRELAPFGRKGMAFAAALLAVAFISAPEAALAQCSLNGPPFNGWVIQNGGTAVFNNNITSGYGTAVTATNSADVTTNGAIVANGGGTGVCADTNSMVTANGPVNAANIALDAMSGATITANGIVIGNTGGGAMAMIADGATIIANGVTLNWPNGFGSSLVEALNGGLIEFNPTTSITNPAAGSARRYCWPPAQAAALPPTVLSRSPGIAPLRSARQRGLRPSLPYRPAITHARCLR